jgi:hypothetical protein
MKPRLLDLFSGAGGCAVGYAQAGFEVVGVDIVPQKNYPYEFHQADAMTYPLEGFDVIHASIPCQGYSVTNKLWRKEYPLLLEPIRERLKESGKPWVIENVPGCPMNNYLMLCGSHFGLQIRRHRHFETSHLILSPFQCKHNYKAIQVIGHAGKEQNFTRATAEANMQIDWMTKPELVQAIPPAYTRWIGEQLMSYIEQEVAV